MAVKRLPTNQLRVVPMRKNCSTGPRSDGAGQGRQFQGAGPASAAAGSSLTWSAPVRPVAYQAAPTELIRLRCSVVERGAPHERRLIALLGRTANGQETLSSQEPSITDATR